ncbi:MAG TPA: shikimate dehydrogenase [Flavobacteriales bacterium]|jgi:shikimate dehydrogenase|nr:shikimate dehydrogenase [Flavobacteriales bacterium]HIO15745.1 shikimate dehydrogenase [Flavobacteriales bacterium]
MTSTKLLGLIGHPVSHSKSPALFADKFIKAGRNELKYSTFDLKDISGFPLLCSENPELVALNVTIPHKETIIPFLEGLSDDAKEIGAVNTLMKIEGKWFGYNTDSWGFRRSIQPFLKGRHERALIFGTGGAAKAVGHALNDLGINYYFVSRSSEKKTGFERIVSYSELTSESLKHYLLLINCTPVGMHPNVEEIVDIPWEGIGEEHLMIDLVYNPEITSFIREARKHGAVAMNGSDMLRLQAEKSWDIWIENGL